MRLFTGEIVEIYTDTRTQMAKVSIGGASIRVPLTFVPDAKMGDRVLVSGGVAIAVIQGSTKGVT